MGEDNSADAFAQRRAAAILPHALAPGRVRLLPGSCRTLISSVWQSACSDQGSAGAWREPHPPPPPEKRDDAERVSFRHGRTDSALQVVVVRRHLPGRFGDAFGTMATRS